MSVVDASTLCNRAPGESRTPPGMPAGVDPTRSSETAAAAAAGAAPVAKGMDGAGTEEDAFGTSVALLHAPHNLIRELLVRES